MFPKKPDRIWANSAVPISVPSLSAVMTRIHPHSPLAIRNNVRLIKSKRENLLSFV